MPGEFKSSVLHWNVLCDALKDGFDKVPSEQVEWDFRRPLIEAQLFGRTDILWDFICMQEVDKHQEIFTSKEAPADAVEVNCSSEDKIKCYLGQTAMREDNLMGCSIYYNA